MANKDKLTNECDIDSSTFLDKVLERAQEKQLDCQLTRYSFDLLERKAHNQSLSIHQLMFSFPDNKDWPEDFLTHRRKYERGSMQGRRKENSRTES